jgi:DNA invertase Pin-like site-specific DNA recombinase
MSKTGQLVSYVRVSSEDQNTARQVEALAHFKIDKTFTEKVSARTTDRPQLQAAINYVREGDTLICASMDRLSRSLTDLLSLVKQLTGRGVKVQFVKENLTFTGNDDSMSQLLLSIMGSLSEWENSVRRERQISGIAIAKAAGVYKGRTAALKPAQISEVRALAESGMPKAQIAEKFNVSRPTIYKALATA